MTSHTPSTDQLPISFTIDAPATGSPTLTVHGDVDLVTARSFETALRDRLSVSALVLDLGGVEFFSSAGVTAIENALAESPHAIDSVIAPSMRVRRTLGVLELDRLVPITVGE